MERGLPPNKLVPLFRAAVDDFRNLLPVVRPGCGMAWCPHATQTLEVPAATEASTCGFHPRALSLHNLTPWQLA